MKFSKEFWVGFQGCEREALSLFMKIDNRRLVKDDDTLLVCSIPKQKSSKEVENFEI